MAQTHQILDFEPWLKPLYYWPLSHGSNPSIIELWAMAQTPKKQDFEPWLKPINYWTLSHGSNPQKMDLWAMAQTHIWHADFHMCQRHGIDRNTRYFNYGQAKRWGPLPEMESSTCRWRSRCFVSCHVMSPQISFATRSWHVHRLGAQMQRYCQTNVSSHVFHGCRMGACWILR